MRLRRRSLHRRGAARGVAIAPRALASAARRSRLRAPHSARARHVVSHRVRRPQLRDITALHAYAVKQALTQDEPIFPPIGDDLAEAAAVAYADSNPAEVVEALGVAAERLARTAHDAGVDVWTHGLTVRRIPKRRASPTRARPPRLATPPERRRPGPCQYAGRFIRHTRRELGRPRTTRRWIPNASTERRAAPVRQGLPGQLRQRRPRRQCRLTNGDAAAPG